MDLAEVFASDTDKFALNMPRQHSQFDPQMLGSIADMPKSGYAALRGCASVAPAKLILQLDAHIGHLRRGIILPGTVCGETVWDGDMEYT